MKPLMLLTAAVVAAGTLTTAASQPGAKAALPAPPAARHLGTTGSTGTISTTVSAAEVQRDRQAVALFIRRTHGVQRRIPVALTPTHHAERHTRSVAFLHWLKHRWHGRWLRAKRLLAAHLLPLTNDWETAVRVVQRDWPGSSSWLLSCSGGEGGHGVWVWNGGTPLGLSVAEAVREQDTGTLAVYGSGAGGWMQFMSGTFSGTFNAAMAKARSLRLPVPPAQTRNWFSALGQAFAAGYAHNFTNYHGPWDPGIDPNCY